MPFTHIILRQYRDTSPNVISLSESVTGNDDHNIDKSMAVGTNTPLAYTLDRTVLQSLAFSSDLALTDRKSVV